MEQKSLFELGKMILDARRDMDNAMILLGVALLEGRIDLNLTKNVRLNAQSVALMTMQMDHQFRRPTKTPPGSTFDLEAHL
ncbi:hypothetical protein [Acidisoma sp. 7E03]